MGMNCRSELSTFGETLKPREDKNHERGKIVFEGYSRYFLNLSMLKKGGFIMKKGLISIVVILFLAGCVTASGPAVSPVKSEGISPKISDLKMPETVSAGDTFPMSFNFEDPEADITSIGLTYDWGSGSESHSYPANASIAGKKSGTAEGKGFIGMGNRGTMKILVHVVDRNGNKSNTLSGNVSIR